jgi:hypothetical protein
MSITFRERLASDPYFSIRISEPERHRLCPYSDRLLEREDPDSMDFDSKIKVMNDEEFRQHVRAAQELQLEDKQKETKKKEKEKEKQKLLIR